MQARTRKRLTIWWVVVLANLLWPFAFSAWVNLGGIVVIAWFFGIGLLVVTLRRVDRGAHLQRPRPYRIAVGLQLVLAAVATVSAAGTVFTHGTPGLISLATAELGASLLAYRALVRPSPKVALWSGIVAMGIAFCALMIDIFLDIHYIELHHRSALAYHPFSRFAVFSVFVQPIVSGLVALAVLRTFGDRTALPDAVASLHPDHHDHDAP